MRSNGKHAVLACIVQEQIRQHPLPWTLHREWAHQVRASDGVVIAQFPNISEAESLLRLAEEHGTASKENSVLCM